MFVSICRDEGFEFQFAQIRRAINAPSDANRHAALRFGVDVIAWRYRQFRQELAAVGRVNELNSSLNDYLEVIAELDSMLETTSEHPRWDLAHRLLEFLEEEHKRFCQAASHIAGDYAKEAPKGFSHANAFHSKQMNIIL